MKSKCVIYICYLLHQAAKDKADNVEGVVDIPADGSKDDVISAVVKNVCWQIDNDRKTPCLKQLQGHIWREGYKTGNIKPEYVLLL